MRKSGKGGQLGSRRRHKFCLLSRTGCRRDHLHSFLDDLAVGSIGLL